MSLIFANIFGWIYANKRTVAILAAILVIAIASILLTRSCGTKPLKIDEEQINKINSQNRAERIKELTAVVEENAEAVQTVGNRSTVAEANVVERNAEVDAKVKEADRQILEAHKQGRDVTAKELECLLTGVCQ